MWVELICGLVLYRIVRRFFFGGDDDDDILRIGSSSSDDVASSTALFSVAHKLERLYGGKAYTGLRIPDPDTAKLLNIDLLLLLPPYSKGEAAILASVKNFSGSVSVDSADGTWVFTSGTKRTKSHRHPDPVAEAKRQIAVLESYLEQRGIALPEGYFSCKVICPNPNFRTVHSNLFSPEVITHEQWAQLKPEGKGIFSGWIKGAIRGGKKEMQESLHQNLGFILGTAPVWDRLELKGDRYLLGEFLEFKGRQDDIEHLRRIKRSKVSRLVIQKTSMFGLAHSKLQVLYSERDYRSEGAISASEWKEVTVRSSTEAIFQPRDSAKTRKFKLSSIVSMSLSA